MEDLDIVIVGGGICGLATALALHRKGISSVVLERSETLRDTGAGIAILTNGWRALQVLGVAPKLRQTALSLRRIWDVDLQRGKNKEIPVSTSGRKGEARCVKRSELIKALADELPLPTIRFGCDVLSVRLDPSTSFPLLQLSNGSCIRAKVLIGCDGANSIVADFLELKQVKMFSLCAVRGFTNYPDGHGFAPELVRMRKGSVWCGRVPVNDKTTFWFVVNTYPKDSKVAQDPELIRKFAIDSITKDFPQQRVEMINNCDLTSISLTHLRYRAPWEILLGRFRRGTLTVAGDAMHVMGPFLGQGGSAGIEDSVVLARCLGPKMLEGGTTATEIGEALDEYVKERRMRLVWLSTQTYLIGSLIGTSPIVVKLLLLVIFLVLFRDPTYHTQYDCGPL